MPRMKYRVPRDSGQWVEKERAMTVERIGDLRGYMLEGITEHDDEGLAQIAQLIVGPDTDAANRILGEIIRQWVTDYCTPDADEVDTALEGES